MLELLSIATMAAGVGQYLHKWTLPLMGGFKCPISCALGLTVTGVGVLGFIIINDLESRSL